MPVAPDDIANSVLTAFEQLPASRKPVIRANGVHEWVPLSGIVAEAEDGKLKCLTLATGAQCLPARDLSEARGNVLHDWHAEVLAIRAFNHFVLEECVKLSADQPSEFLVRLDSHSALSPRAFTWREGVKLHIYCSEAPCGDASMELTMATQEDPTPWTSTQTTDGLICATSSLHGREDFSRLGIVRRKPGRGDAPQTLSKSCSDKLALKQCTSLLSSPAALLVSPGHIYLSSLVLPMSCLSFVACERAFAASGRMKTVAGRIWTEGYKFSPFDVLATSREFHYSKQAVGDRASKIASSNAALVWSCNGLQDRLIGGVKEGRRKADPRCGSRVSRRSLWKLLQGALVHGPADLEESQGTLGGDAYEKFKNCHALKARQHVKADVRSLALPNWQRNTGDDQFSLTEK